MGERIVLDLETQREFREVAIDNIIVLWYQYMRR